MNNYKLPQVPFTIFTLLRGALFLLFFFFTIYAVITTASYIWLACFLVFLFYEVGVYSYTFDRDAITLKFLYFRKKVITADQITRIVIKPSTIGDKIEIDWKKSPKKSTRIIKIPLSWFREKEISDEEALEFLKSIYKK